MWRHGDVLIAAVATVPSAARKLPTCVLARGEMTGHSHRIEQPDAAEVWQYEGQLFLKIIGDRAVLIHEEHKPITLPHGTYRVWQQREYTPRAIRTVVD